MSDYKLLLFGKEAREKLAVGADTLTRAVVSTYGPVSHNVAINNPYPGPVILHDGVSVAKAVHLKDPYEDMGAALIREAAAKTNDLAGDGTTTATLLANTLFQGGLKLVEGGVVDGVITESLNPMLMRKELDSYAELIIHMLEQKAITVDKKKEYQEVATISSASEEIGQLVADAIEKVGADGVVMVENSGTFDSFLEIQEGFKFDNGYLTPAFVTDRNRMLVDYKDAYVLLTDYNIADQALITPLVTKVIKENKPLLIIADDVSGPALAALALTKVRLEKQLVAVVAPEFGERRREVLEDLAILTGCKVITKESGKSLQDVELKDLGRLRSLTITQTHTELAPANVDAKDVEERLEILRSQLKEEKNAFKRERLQARISNFAQAVAIINVGGGADTEVSDKRERVIDAIYATRAALAEGVVPGGGVALRDIARNLRESTLPLHLKDSRLLELVITVLNAPILTILKNSGRVNPEEFLEHKAGQGLNVVTGEAVDMREAGIVDAVKVTKLAVRHAFSVAATALTTNTLITDDLDADRNVQTVRPI